MAGGEKLQREITARGIWLLAVNGMIGAGIFAVPGGAAALVGVWSPLVYVVCAVLLGLIVACYAELASRFTSTGGPVLYVRTAFGKFAGFETGLAVYATRITAFAARFARGRDVPVRLPTLRRAEDKDAAGTRGNKYGHDFTAEAFGARPFSHPPPFTRHLF